MDSESIPNMTHREIDAGLNAITGDVVDAAVLVHSVLGPGLLERVYRRCLAKELTKRGHRVAEEVAVPVTWDGESITPAYRIDILVDDVVLVEVKAVDALGVIHATQVRTYLKLAGLQVGLLLNFNTPVLSRGMKRIVS